MNHRPNALAIALALATVAGGAGAAQRVDLHAQNAAQLGQQYRIATRGAAVATAAVRHAEMISLDASSGLQSLNSRSDERGNRQHRYQLTWRGLPVFGQHVIVSEDAGGNVRTIFGERIQGLDAELPSATPRLDRARALQLAKRAAFGARQAQMRIDAQKIEPVVFLDRNDRAHLAYRVDLSADSLKGGEMTAPLLMLDAHTGKVLMQIDNLQHAKIGTGPGGNQKTGQYEYGTDFGFLDVAQNGGNCVMQNANVKTINLNHATNGTTVHSYACPRNTVKSINGAFSPLNDAHFFGGVVYDMYQGYLNMPALTVQLTLRVHYSNNFENANWDPQRKIMTFGDGANRFHPLVSLDVLGHEVSHGFTQEQSGLIYSGQSGGINEAFSDMAGEASEFFMSGTNDFMVGAQIVKGTGALRYMANPPQDGRSIGHARDYRDGMDVHLSSGVFNKAFHLIATSAGWDTRKAFVTFAKANIDYWTPNSTFVQGACGVEQAAADLGHSVADVSAAFAAVGVDCPGGTGPGPGTGTQTYSNGTDVAIGDNTTVESAIAVSGRSGNAPANASVSLNIVHTYRGDLKVDLVAPDGSLYNLHNRSGGSADNLSGSFPLDLSSETLNGTWKLRVNDNSNNDTGRIDSWSITF